MGVLLENKLADPNFAPYPRIFYPLVRSLFASRRKTIKNNLASFVSNKEICAQILAENALSGMERAEELGADVFLSLAKSLERCNHIR